VLSLTSRRPIREDLPKIRDEENKDFTGNADTMRFANWSSEELAWQHTEVSTATIVLKEMKEGPARGISV